MTRDTAIASINWEQLWEAEMSQSSWSKNSENWWDQRAEAFDRHISKSAYVDRMLEKIIITPHSTVLDVGCGPGTLAIPLAKRVRKLTALDLSQEMLRFVMNNAQAENVRNITCLRQRWEDSVIGRDIEPHDIVICSRAFPEIQPIRSLHQFHDAARHAVYITMWANGDEYESFYRSTYRTIGKSYKAAPDYIYVYNMLYQMGIHANVEFVEYTDYMRYSMLDEAMKDWIWRIRPDNEEQKQQLREHLHKNFRASNDSGLEMNLHCRWALIWWEKAEFC